MKIIIISGYDEPEEKSVLTASGNLSVFGKEKFADLKKFHPEIKGHFHWDKKCYISSRYGGYIIVPDSFNLDIISDGISIADADDWFTFSDLNFTEAVKWIRPYWSAGEAAEELGYSIQRITQLCCAADGISGAYRNRSGWQIPAEWICRGRVKQKPGPKGS